MYRKNNRTSLDLLQSLQETAAKFTIVNRDQHALPLWPDISSVFQQVTVQRHNCIKPQEQTWRLREKLMERNFGTRNCHNLWRLDINKNNNVEYVVCSLLMDDVKKGIFPLVFLFNLFFSILKSVYSWCSPHSEQPFDHTLSTMTRTWFLHGYSFPHNHGSVKNNYELKKQLLMLGLILSLTHDVWDVTCFCKKISHSPMDFGRCVKNICFAIGFFQDLSILAQAFASWRHGESGPKVAQFLRAEAMRQMQVTRQSLGGGFWWTWIWLDSLGYVVFILGITKTTQIHMEDSL